MIITQMDINQVLIDLKNSGCKTLAEWTGDMASNMEEFKNFILNEYGEDSHQAKRYGIIKLDINSFN
tara:strand:+ start:1499 stop:1699 length:201 start_codon:yes stop_codon:yes gene_type:complete